MIGESVRAALRRLQRIERPDALAAAAIRIDAGEECLLPVCDFLADDKRLVTLLAQWRGENMHIFPLPFRVTPESTEHWIRHQLLRNPNRVLFVAFENPDEPVGQIGLTYHHAPEEHFEFENVIRGRESSPGLMSRALVRLMQWAKERFYCGQFRLYVLNDNPRAIRFYESNGFRQIGVRMLDGTELSLEEVSRMKESRHFIRMEAVPAE